MLNIVFGKRDDVYYGPGWFVNNYTGEWLEDVIVQKMIKDIDKSEYRGGELIYSNVLGPIPPEKLSGGVKTLISIYKTPDHMFDATSCGNNCSKWLLDMGKQMDITVNLNYPMEFEDCEGFEIHIENNDKIYYKSKEYLLAALDVLHKERFE